MTPRSPDPSPTVLPRRGGRGRGSAQNGGDYSDRDHLAVVLGDLARSLQQERDPGRVLAAIVQAALVLVPGAVDGSIMVVTGRRTSVSWAPSSELAETVDALQTASGQGPCLDAAYSHRTVRVDDLAEETRWPAFSRVAAAAGARSMLSLQLFVDGDDLGALNLYGDRPGTFTDESEHVGLVFAAHAAIAFSAAQRQEDLERALDNRDLIGQAKGILIERHKITGHQAFGLLQQISNTTNRKVAEVAEDLVTSGALHPPT